MLYFKNSEIAKRYHVSLGTVRNWISAAEKERLKISLFEHGEKKYIANTAVNMQIMDELVGDGRKYRNFKSLKQVKPRHEFYETYSAVQIYDIVRNLEINREIPLQYSYFREGAEQWDEYVNRLANEDAENSYNASQKLFTSNLSSFDTLLKKYDRVNIIDIGCGNAMPVKSILTHLLELKKLGRYIALDISPDMLKIAKRNINSWFGDSINFEGYVRNINHERFTDLLLSEYFVDKNESTVNVILHLGYTLYNMQRPENGYRTIYDSIGENDLLVEDVKLDSEISRNYFDFDVDETGSSNSLVLNLLNLEPSFYDVELGFDELNHNRYERIRFKVNVELEVALKKGKRTVIFEKDETLLTWRIYHRRTADIINERNKFGFNVIHSSLTDSQHYMLAFSKADLVS